MPGPGERGAGANADPFTTIDPWEHLAEPLEAVRQRFNVLPRGRDPEWAEPGT